MKIMRTTRAAIERAAERTPGVAVDFERVSASRGGGETFNVRLTLPHGQNRETYRRVSADGRRIAAVCWHGFRDFYRALFESTPDAIVVSALARYEGSDDFEAVYPSTAYRNIGSAYRPLAYSSACVCADSGCAR